MYWTLSGSATCRQMHHARHRRYIRRLIVHLVAQRMACRFDRTVLQVPQIGVHHIIGEERHEFLPLRRRQALPMGSQRRPRHILEVEMLRRHAAQFFLALLRRQFIVGENRRGLGDRRLHLRDRRASDRPPPAHSTPRPPSLPPAPPSLALTLASDLPSQNGFSSIPACLIIPFAVCRDLMSLSMGNLRLLSGLYQIS